MFWSQKRFINLSCITGKEGIKTKKTTTTTYDRNTLDPQSSKGWRSKVYCLYVHNRTIQKRGLNVTFHQREREARTLSTTKSTRYGDILELISQLTYLHKFVPFVFDGIEAGRYSSGRLAMDDTELGAMRLQGERLYRLCDPSHTHTHNQFQLHWDANLTFDLNGVNWDVWFAHVENLKATTFLLHEQTHSQTGNKNRSTFHSTMDDISPTSLTH